MNSVGHQSGDFISYPVNRVVGTIVDSKGARAAIEELLNAGFEAADIDILHKEKDLHRLDQSGRAFEHRIVTDGLAERPRAMAKRKQSSAPKTNPLEWAGVRVERVVYESGATIFRQGDPCITIIYIEKGSVRLSVVLHAGKEAVIAVLEGGDFFGEGCLAGQSVRTATATAMSECAVLRIRRQEIARRLHAEESFADSFVSHVLKRNIRMEEDLIDQLFNSTEKRLARTILLLAQYGKNDGPRRVLPKISQEILAEMVPGRPDPVSTSS